MRNDVTAIQENPAKSTLEEILREGARQLLQQAIQEEVSEYVATHQAERDSSGKRLVTRNGHLPGRDLQTGVGQVPIEQPRVRDRAEGRSFSSQLLPKYKRKVPSIEALIPELYLRGVSTGDFSEALKAILGEAAPGLSPNTIIRLKSQWAKEYKEWQERSFEGERYVYFWADAIYFNVRMSPDRPCLLVIMGATEDGKKEIHDIYQAPSLEKAEEAFEAFLKRYQVKYPKACVCLRKDREVLLTFYSFPAEHWGHIRSTNVIESAFATVRHRTRQTRNCCSRESTLTMAFKMSLEAEKGWRRLNSPHLISKVVKGVKFKDGEEVNDLEKVA